jgi:DNA-directed RNA polymerase specialized sigma24 family protein
MSLSEDAMQMIPTEPLVHCPQPTLAAIPGLGDDAPVEKLTPTDAEALPPAEAVPAATDELLKRGDPREALLADKDFRQGLVNFFTRRTGHEAEDLAQEVCIEISRSKSFPTNKTEQVPYAFGIARNIYKDWFKKRLEQRTAEERVAAEPTVRGVEAVEDRQLLERLVEGLPEAQIPTLRWLARQLLGKESLAQIAKEANVDYDVAYKRVVTLQRRLERTALGLVGLTLLFIVVGAVYTRSQAPIAHKDTPLPTPSSVPSQEPSATPEMMEARRLREKAFRDCAPGAFQPDYLGCLVDLEQAKDLDPAGDGDPRVKKVRADAVKVLYDHDGGRRDPKREKQGP